MDTYVGEIRMVGFGFAPAGWALCDGQMLSPDENYELFQLLGTTYGGDGQSSFALPDLQGRIPIGTGQGGGLSNRLLGEQGGTETVPVTTAQLAAHRHLMLASQDAAQGESPAGSVLAAGGSVELYSTDPPEVALSASSIGADGGGQPHDNLQPYLVVNFIISLAGLMPTTPLTWSDPFIGEIRIMASSQAPSGWAVCSGQLMALSHNTILFSLLGTNFGGDGKTTFALPNLMDAVPMGSGQGEGLSQRSVGDSGGSETTTLLGSELPPHAHTLNAMPGQANAVKPTPATTLAASVGGEAYNTSAATPTALSPQALTPAGGSVPHNNLQPYLALNYYIATQGDYPPRA